MMKLYRSSSRPGKWFGWLAIASVFSAVLYMAYSLLVSANFRSLPIHSSLPSSSTISTLAGNRISFDSLVQSKSVIFWFSTKCPFCWDHVFRLDSIGRQLPNNRSITGISSEPSDVLIRFKNRHKLLLPIYRMERDEARSRFHVATVPTFFFVNEHRKIERIISTTIDHDTACSLIRSFLQ